MTSVVRRLTDLFDSGPVSDRRAAVLRRVVAALALALFAATWRLWTPQSAYPQVPLLYWAGAIPPWCQWAAGALVVLTLLVALVAPQSSRLWRLGLQLFAAMLALLVLIDQHRLQPWAYQLALVAIVLAGSPPRQGFALLRLLTVSLYGYSAWSKFDYAFLHTLGQQFLSALAGCLGASTSNWPDEARLAAAWAFPLGESAVALGLCVPRVRPLALAGAIVLHLLLLVILGPLGLGHKPGVLIWNLFFIVQNLVLFAAAGDRCANNADRAGGRPARLSLARGAVLAAVVLPLLEPSGWFDIWPSWGLYAPRAERVSLLIARRAARRLPESVRNYLAESDGGGQWVELRIDRWSLSALDAPIYPQNRFQLGVAAAVGRRFGLDRQIRAVRLELADRLSGERRQEILTHSAQIAAAGDRYWLNSHPRGPFVQR